MFSSLRKKQGEPTNKMGLGRVRASNTTNANTLVLKAGSMIVGGDRDSRMNDRSGTGTGTGTETGTMPGNEAGIEATVDAQAHPHSHPHSHSHSHSHSQSHAQYQTHSHSFRQVIDGIELNRAEAVEVPRANADGNIEVRSRRTTQVNLVYHETRHSEHLVMLDLATLKHIKEGQLCELMTYRKRAHNSGSARDKKIYFIARDFDAETRRRCKNFGNISVAVGHLQSLLDLPPRSKVWVKVKNKAEMEADLIELHIKDILLNRGDMWCLSSEIVDSCAFSGQKLTFLDSIRTTVNGIYRNGKKVLSGYIGENTKIVFRSESARLLFIIQITNEMWSFDETGEQMFQKMINSFFPKIFKRWKDIDTHHSITIAFAISMDMSSQSHKDLKPGERIKNTTDYFRIVVDQVSVIYWTEIMETLRKEFMEITEDLLCQKSDDENGFSVIKGRFTPVIKSNILELINFAATTIVDPFKQIDLRHTSTHVMIISPGKGLYDVDYDLLRLSCQKLLCLEITMDLICLSRPPLHVVPLFRYIDYENKLHHGIPPWLNIFFWNDKTKDTTKWTPKCQIYDLQMMGLTDNEVVEKIELEYLSPTRKEKDLSTLMSNYDRDIFLHPDERSVKDNHLQKNENIDSKRDIVNNNILTNTKNLVIPNAKFMEPVIEDVQTPVVTGNMYLNKIEETSFSNSEGTRAESSVMTESVSALTSLKDITKKSSIRDFTQKIITRLMPNKDCESNENNTINFDVEISNAIEENYNSVSERSSNKSKILPHQKDLNLSSEQPSAVSKEDMIHKLNFQLFGTEGSEIEKKNSSQMKDRLTISRYNSGNPTLGSNKTFEIHASGSPQNQTRSKSPDSDLLSLKFVNTDDWVEILGDTVPVHDFFKDDILPTRWRDVWPKDIFRKYSKWRSFTTPAELPITIPNFPSRNELENNFTLRNHSVTLNWEQELYNFTAKDLLRSMIYLRLLVGFQICTSKEIEEVELSKKGDRDIVSIHKYIKGDVPSNFKIYMILGPEIHRLHCDPSGIINVERYIAKRDRNVFDQVPSYNSFVKTRYDNKYRETKVDPIHMNRPDFNWNLLDQFLAGYSDPYLSDRWHGFRSKYVVLPTDIPQNTFSMVVNGKNETLTAEEIRVEGLRKLITSITKLKLLTAEEKKQQKGKKSELQSEVIFYTGSLFDFLNEQQTQLDSSILNFKDSIFGDSSKKLNRNIDLRNLSQEIQLGENRLLLVTRKWHWKKHANCFVGSEMVNWLIRNFSDIETRSAAVEYGQKLMNDGLFIHVLNSHSFLDGHYFYQISPDYVIDTKIIEKSCNNLLQNSDSKNTLKRVKSESSSETNLNSSNLVMTTKIASEETEESLNAAAQVRKTVVLSNSMIINVDPSSKSYKPETCTVHYDRVHNPEHCFHIRLEWLTTTPKLIDILLANWSRICERYGLKLIEIPWNELCTIPNVDPFHTFVLLKLAINPWEDPEFKDSELFSRSKFYYHIHLLKISGFLLDNRASKFFNNTDTEFNIQYSWGTPQFKYAQYIHSTGAYIAEMRENGDIFLAPNNVYISRVNRANVVSRTKSGPTFKVDAQKVIMEFSRTCSSYVKLRTVFLDAKENWLRDRNIEE
ncbi:Vacuolar membrane-associated protein IML1 [Nakaseomyces bracarensis]|uniref:Vacuolar membrane-associated protein IML1 n=1 Tax=Nakaseomyces bracarensis TaxID=273131 RepID=A0ABR4NT44_9SACH